MPDDPRQSPDRAPTEPHDLAADCWCAACVDADRALDVATIERARADFAAERVGDEDDGDPGVGAVPALGRLRRVEPDPLRSLELCAPAGASPGWWPDAAG